MAALLEGRRALVTGAAGGIGAAVVTALREHGADVTAADLAERPGIRACDVTDEDAVRELFAAEPYDDVVHAAGVVVTGAVAETPLAAFRQVLEVNLVGAFLVAREAARTARDGTAITLVASQGARKGGARWAAYCASKFGVVGLAESLAQELGPIGARVNCVCPGTVDTAMTRRVAAELGAARGEDPADVLARYVAGVPLGRMATPADVAGACVYLASPLARYVSGASLVVDGGELS